MPGRVGFVRAKEKSSKKPYLLPSGWQKESLGEVRIQSVMPHECRGVKLCLGNLFFLEPTWSR